MSFVVVSLQLFESIRGAHVGLSACRDRFWFCSTFGTHPSARDAKMKLVRRIESGDVIESLLL